MWIAIYIVLIHLHNSYVNFGLIPNKIHEVKELIIN